MYNVNYVPNRFLSVWFTSANLTMMMCTSYFFLFPNDSHTSLPCVSVTNPSLQLSLIIPLVTDSGCHTVGNYKIILWKTTLKPYHEISIIFALLVGTSFLPHMQDQTCLFFLNHFFLQFNIALTITSTLKDNQTRNQVCFISSSSPFPGHVLN